ncbi:MAG: protein phosphatase 2C domain-containing protein [bacterium]|nr:protein phosphatase 2C domain-containing protein [bacterium]
MRRQSEDWAAGEFRDGRLACALCDGMGGMRHGDRAARRAADAFIQLCLHDERCLSAAWPPSLQRVQLELAGCLGRLQAELRERRVATTFTGLALDGQIGRLYHVGDSRAYLVSGGCFRQLSTDHHVSVEQPNLLSHALGAPQHDQLCCVELRLEAGDRLLLCSDGFVQAGIEATVLDQLLQSATGDDDIPGLLMEEALSRGAEDNLSLVWINPETEA